MTTPPAPTSQWSDHIRKNQNKELTIYATPNAEKYSQLEQCARRGYRRIQQTQSRREVPESKRWSGPEGALPIMLARHERAIRCLLSTAGIYGLQSEGGPDIRG